MKKLGMVLAAVLLALCIAMPAGAGDKIRVTTTHSAVSVAASDSSTSAAIDLEQWRPTGYFTVYWVLTGTGTAKFEYLVSLDGTNYVEPSGASDIASGKTAGSDIVSFTPVVAPYMKIKVTETGGANAVTATVYLCVQ